MRKSVLVAAVTAGLTVAATAGVVPAGASPHGQAAAASVPGSFVPVTQYRALDTYTGTYGNRKGALPHGGTTGVSLAARVPTTAAAAVVSISAVGSTAGGSITASAHGTARPGVTDLLYAKGVSTTNTVVVPLHNAVFDLYNGATIGSTELDADVLGYYVGGDVSTNQNTAAGLLHMVTPTRVFTTPSAGVAAGASITAEVPPAQAGRISVLVSVYGATSGGALAAYSYGSDTPSLSDVYFPAGNSTGFAVVPSDSTGRIQFRNNSSAGVHFAIDEVAWAVGGAAVSAGAEQVGAGQRYVAGHVTAAGAVSSVGLPGYAGVPLSGATAAVVRVIVSGPTKAGGIDVAAAGHSSAALRTLSFTAGQRISTTAVVPLNAGRLEVRNASSGTLSYYLDVLGFVAVDTITPPAGAQVGRYPNDLSGTLADDEATMSAHGCADATAGASFVLLDIGAQTVTSPLSAANPGVALANTGEPAVHISYPDIVADIESYANGFAGCGTQALTLAVGTNTSGVWTQGAANYYAPATRGSDWATKVVLPIAKATPSTVSVVGANDIEANFNAADAQVQTWETSYLAALDAGAFTGLDRHLVDNGGLAGCPQTFHDTTDCVTSNDNGGTSDWTQAQLETLAYNGGSATYDGRVEVLPQIYGGFDAVRWTNLDRISGSKLTFVGVLTNSERAETYTALQGWAAFERALSSQRSGSSLAELPRTVVDLANDAR